MKRIFLLLILLPTSGELFSQNKIGNESIVKDLREIRTSVVSTTCDGCKEMQDSMLTIINGTLININQLDKTAPPKYAFALRLINSFAQKMVVKGNKDQAVDLKLLLKDFKLKFQKTHDNLSTQSLLNLVKVEVTVKDNIKAINNLSVHYCCLGEKPNYANPSNTFQALTSPALDSLIPGIYYIWITEGGNAKVLTKTISEIDPLKTNKISLYVDR